MKLRQSFAADGDRPKVRRDRDARKLAAEIRGVFRPVLRMVQQAVDIVEYIPFRDRFIRQLLAKFLQPPVRDIVVSLDRIRDIL